MLPPRPMRTRWILIALLAGCHVEAPEPAPRPTTEGPSAEAQVAEALVEEGTTTSAPSPTADATPPTPPEAAPPDTLPRGPRGEPVSVDSFRVLVAAASAQSGGAAVELLHAGSFHGDEVDAETGERWQGLYPNGDGFEVRALILQVETVYDEMVDGLGDPPTGRRVTTPFSTADRTGVWDDAVVLFQRGRPVPSGAVDASFHGYEPLQSGYRVLSLGDQGYELAVVEGPEVPNEWIEGPYRPERVLTLSDGLAFQPLSHLVDRDGGEAVLLWAGDLDGDGRLDLLTDESDHYNLSRTTLYLSSHAAPGALVGRAGRWETTGC